MAISLKTSYGAIACEFCCDKYYELADTLKV